MATTQKQLQRFTRHAVKTLELHELTKKYGRGNPHAAVSLSWFDHAVPSTLKHPDPVFSPSSTL